MFNFTFNNIVAADEASDDRILLFIANKFRDARNAYPLTFLSKRISIASLAETMIDDWDLSTDENIIAQRIERIVDVPESGFLFKQPVESLDIYDEKNNNEDEYSVMLDPEILILPEDQLQELGRSIGWSHFDVLTLLRQEAIDSVTNIDKVIKDNYISRATVDFNNHILKFNVQMSDFNALPILATLKASDNVEISIDHASMPTATVTIR